MSLTLEASSRKLTAANRVALAGLGILGLTLLIAARFLEPDPRGYGTHEQLGFSPCSFLRWTGRICPTCGATTAWSYALRGEILQATTANLGGVLSCMITLIGVPWLLLSAVRGRWLIGQPRLQPLLILGTAWLLVVILDWLRRYFIG